MAFVANIIARVGADISEFQKQMKQAQKTMERTGQKLKDIGANLTTFVTAPIIAAAGASIKLASDIEESINKVNVAFKDSGKDVIKWSNTTLKTFGISKGSALDMAALYGDMGTAMGQTPKDAAKMSTSLVGLAGDLASFKNIGIEQAQDALKGIFTGEGESLKSLGVIMQDSTLKAYALSTGQKKAYDEMSQAEKVALRYAFVMNATKNAQGDFARTSGGAANQMRIFQESMKELGAKLGEVLLPTFTVLVSKLNELVQWFGTLNPSAQKFIVVGALIAAALAPLIFIIGTLISSLGAIAGALAAISAPVMIVIGVIAGLTAAFIYLWNTNEGFRTAIIGIWEGIKINLTSIWGNIKIIAESIWNGLKAFWKAFGDEITKSFIIMWDGITRIISGTFNIIQGIFNIFVGVFSGDWDKAWNGIKDVLSGVWNIISSSINTSLEAIKLVFKTIWDYVKDKILIPIYNWLVDTFKPVFDGIYNVFNTSLGLILDVIKNTWNHVKDDVMLPVFNWISDTFNPIFDTIKNSLETAWNGLVEIASGIWNGITDTLKTAVNSWINLINYVIDKINSIKIEVPKVDIPGIGQFGGYSIGFPKIPQIPMLASGGVITSPTLAMVGEAGREAVIPLENDSFIDSFASKVGTAILGAMQFGSGQSKSGDIVLQIDGTQFARIINPYQAKENQRIGIQGV